MDDIKRIGRKLVHKGAILDIYSDTILFSNGNTEEWDYVEHRKGAAAIIPVLPNGNIILVEQYRNAQGCNMLEIPAGAKNFQGEDSRECAIRELREETGYLAGRTEYLYTCATTVAFCNESVDVFVAWDLKKTCMNPDENEFIRIKEYKIEELTEMIFSGAVRDSKTVGAILAYKEKYLNQV